ncbi:MAG: HAD hydrolase-like protein [Bacteroidales bacterium]|nr:HAD hydrolase-like protein [Bacteroidales bacterium]
MSYSHIIFDLDGTLINPEKGIRDSFAYAIQKMQVDINLDDYYLKLIGPPLHHGFSKVLKMSDHDADRAVKYFREYYGKQGFRDSVLYEGIHNLHEELCKNGKKIYLASSKLEKYAIAILKDKDLLRYYEYVAGATYKGSGADKDILIRRVLEKISLSGGDQVAMIGDTKFDILGARDAGIDSIAILYGYGNEADFTEAGATHIAADVQALRLLLL